MSNHTEPFIESYDDIASGYFVVYTPDGTRVSQHREERKAKEAAFDYAVENNLGGEYRITSPEYTLTIRMQASVISQTTAAVVSGSNASRIATILNGREPHFAYNMPADPVTTQEITVASAADFTAYAGQSPPTGTAGGWVITINESFSGAVNITADDIDVVMSNAATITGTLSIGGTGLVSRVRWTGGNLVGSVYGWRHNDLLFDDFWAYVTGDGSEDNHQFGRASWNSEAFFRRLAVLNSTFEVRKSSAGIGNAWSFFTQQNPDSLNDATRHEDLLFLNSKSLTTGVHTHRIMSVRRMVYVDSAFNPDRTASSTGMRMHLGCEDVWFKDSWAVNGMAVGHVSTAGEGVHVGNGLFDNFDRYVDGSVYMYGAFVDPYPNTGEVINSTLYSEAGASGSIDIGGGITLGAGNSRGAWDGVTVPDYSTVGAIR